VFSRSTPVGQPRRGRDYEGVGVLVMPIDLNGTIYKLCLLDTNAISEMVKHPSREFRHFIDLTISRKFLPCFSVFCVLELRQRQDLYEKFLDLFSIYPCLVLKGHKQLMREEIKNYPDPTGITPVLCGFPGMMLHPDNTLRKTLDLVFQSQTNRDKENWWNQEKIQAVEDIVKLVENYPPEKGTYTVKEIRLFLFLQIISQLYTLSPNFLNSLKSKGEGVEINSFPAAKMITYTMFYKFYVDARQPMESDTFDFLISALTPYVDAIITESHQAEVIKKIKCIDHFLDNVEVYRLRDLRNQTDT
jgi:hypothetical protein